MIILKPFIQLNDQQRGRNLNSVPKQLSLYYG